MELDWQRFSHPGWSVRNTQSDADAFFPQQARLHVIIGPVSRNLVVSPMGCETRNRARCSVNQPGAFMSKRSLAH